MIAKLWKFEAMQKHPIKTIVCAAILAAATLVSIPAAASRPGGGPEGPASCTVMGKIVRVDADKRSAIVTLLEISGSSTQMGCVETGAQAMVDKKAEVNVMVDSSTPPPAVGVGDIVFIVVGEGGALSFQTFFQSTEQIDEIVGEAQIHFDNKLERQKWLYAIKSFIGTQLVVDALVQRIDPDTTSKERRLGAALMLIILAQDKQTVPPDALQTAMRIGLMESRKTAVGNSIRLFPADPYQVVNQLQVMLRDKEGVPDPFATIVALGEMGSIATRALGDVIDRMNDANIGMVRDKKEEADIFRAAVEKMHGEDDAAKYFLKRAMNKEIKDPIGPLAEGMCALKGDTTMLQKVAEWCKSR
jgi:hypothetical protein